MHTKESFDESVKRLVAQLTAYNGERPSHTISETENTFAGRVNARTIKLVSPELDLGLLLNADLLRVDYNLTITDLSVNRKGANLVARVVAREITEQARVVDSVSGDLRALSRQMPGIIQVWLTQLLTIINEGGGLEAASQAVDVLEELKMKADPIVAPISDRLKRQRLKPPV
ncbi:hypothetical protein [Fibrella aquatica]|uniref:hypothetical protein n=1 Tax=Fibrella aquatica TaxID=3242487 RepID=UPI00351FF0F3